MQCSAHTLGIVPLWSEQPCRLIARDTVTEKGLGEDTHRCELLSLSSLPTGPTSVTSYKFTELTAAAEPSAHKFLSPRDGCGFTEGRSDSEAPTEHHIFLVLGEIEIRGR